MNNSGVVGGSGGYSNNAKTEEKKYPAYGTNQTTSYANGYNRPMDDGTNKRATPVVTNAHRTVAAAQGGGTFGGPFGGYGRSGTAHANNAGGGVKDALNYNPVPAPRIATTNVRVRIKGVYLYNNIYRTTRSEDDHNLHSYNENTHILIKCIHAK